MSSIKKSEKKAFFYLTLLKNLFTFGIIFGLLISVFFYLYYSFFLTLLNSIGLSILKIGVLYAGILGLNALSRAILKYRIKILKNKFKLVEKMQNEAVKTFTDE